MTISSSTSRVDYVGNGSTTAFAVPFAFFDASELRVVARVIATGVETVQALGTNYTVSGGNGTTGTVTATVAPAATVQWSILRNTRRTQDVDFQPNDPLPAETLERGLDRVVAIVQEIERDQLRSVRAAETDSTASLTLPTQAERANRNLGFDVNGNPVPVLPQAGTLTVTPYAQGILSSGNAATARGVLGSTTVGDALFVAATAAAARGTLGAGATGDAVFTAGTPAAAQTTLGISAFVQTLLDDANAAAARITLGAVAIPATGGVVGLSTAVGAGLVLPGTSGQTYLYFAFTATSAGAVTGAVVAGVNVGATVVDPGVPGQFWVGFAWRVL
jgi:hypothetical protein